MGHCQLWPLLLLLACTTWERAASDEDCATGGPTQEDPGQSEAVVFLQAQMSLQHQSWLGQEAMTVSVEQAPGLLLVVPALGMLMLSGLFYIGRSPLSKQRAMQSPPPPAHAVDASRPPRSTWRLFLDTDVLCLALLACIIGASAFMLSPLLPTMEHDMHISAFALSVLVISFNASGCLTSSLLGLLSDLRGAREIMLHCIFYFFLTMVIAAFLTSYPSLLVSRLLAGVYAHTFALFNQVLSEIMSEKEIAQAIGILGMCMNLGSTAGSGLAGVVAGPRNDHRNFCLLVSALLLVTMGLAVVMKGGRGYNLPARPNAREGAPPQSLVASFRCVFSSHPLVPLMFFVHLMNFTICPMILQNTAYWVDEVLHAGTSVTSNAMFFSGAGLLFSTMFVLGPGVHRFGELHFVFIVCIGHLVSLIAAIFVKDVSVGYIVSVVQPFFNILVEPCCVAVVNSLTPVHLSGTVGGIFGSSRSLGMLVGVLGQGVLKSASVYASIYVAVALQALSLLCQLPGLLAGARSPGAATGGSATKGET